MEKDIRYVRSAIEDLAFTNRSSREAIWVPPYCRRVCIEHDFDKGFKIRTNTGKEVSVIGIRNKRAELRSRREGR
jgi:hypothetical protein